MSGADALLRQILANGVDTIFGLPGGQLDHFFDSMYRAGEQVRFVGSRHEQGAAYMAFGYARSTGRPGVYTVVPGPGVLNTTAALCSAYATNTPVLCLTGQIPSEGIGKGIGYLHELPDQLATLASLSKWASRIDTPQAAPERVNEAFRQMQGGRPRPVSLEMPMDIMGARAAIPAAAAFAPQPPPELDLDGVAEAARLLAGARNPLIIVGGGATHAAEEVRALAEMLQAPVAAFRSGRGVLPDDHPLSQLYPAAYALWPQVDVLVGVGTRLEFQHLMWGVPAHMKVIRIDIDPEEPARIQAPAVALHADARAALAALADALGRQIERRADRTEQMQDLKARMAAEMAVVQPQMDYLAAIRSALPRDGYFVDEITQVGYASWVSFPVYAPRHLVTCGYQGTLGYGYATALGVKVAHPDKAVVNIAGDGGFMFTSNELATAAQYGIGLVTVLFNNNKFQNVQRQQKEWFGGRIIGSDLRNPDFRMFVESFGVAYRRAESPEALRAAIVERLEAGGPAVIEVPCGDMAAPWPFILRPRVFASEAA